MKRWVLCAAAFGFLSGAGASVVQFPPGTRTVEELPTAQEEAKKKERGLAFLIEDSKGADPLRHSAVRQAASQLDHYCILVGVDVQESNAGLPGGVKQAIKGEKPPIVVVTDPEGSKIWSSLVYNGPATLSKDLAVARTAVRKEMEKMRDANDPKPSARKRNSGNNRNQIRRIMNQMKKFQAPK